MSSFSRDENGNILSFTLPPPLYESTPNKTRNVNVNKKALICHVCQKTYEKEFYFNKHLLSHDSQKDSDVANESASSLNSSLNDLSLSVLSASVAPSGNNFKVPALPQNKKKVTKKPNFVCTYCLKGYMSIKAFQGHVRVHVLQDACKRFPSRDKILDSIDEIGTRALTEVSNCVACGTNGLKFKQLIGHVIAGINNSPATFKDFCTSVAEELLQPIADKMVILPSAFAGILFDKMESILSDEYLCNNFLSKLDLVDFDYDTQCNFFLEFMMNITLNIFRFISQSFRDCYPSRATQVHSLDLEQRQVIFYIGGSIMRGYLKMGRRHKNNSKWQNIVSVLKNEILCEKPEGDLDAQWTADVDRGSLLYIRAPVQEFLKRVALVVYGSEHANGSVDYEEVIIKVSKSSITNDWDDIIRDSLAEDVSLNLMNDVVTYLCKAIGRGIAKRRLNAIRQKPVINLPTRVSVAKRKKK
ncbi:Zinc finger and SCAN domain-containing protein 10 [Frankliniella fusca]|uniref:Zinc finger and SCAN domain-containing protein 10 n=1 Tax=Frankliniella fusca TaxID=407009 RepID=A0AAE1LNF0_9NEOP|nr:Zinc finger and SCAN domain-containing protein 10 [Frankliniella fusca]